MRRAVAHSTVPGWCTAEGDRVIRERIRTIAPVLAILTLAWLLLDRAALPPRDLAAVIVVRLATAVALFALSRHVVRMRARTALRVFVALQALGFGVIQCLLMDAREASMVVGYGLFPFVVAAELALFPTPWLHTLRLAVAPAALLAITLLAGGRAMDVQAWNGVWLLVLLIAVAAWTAQAQLHLLVGLLGARREASHDVLTGLANRRHADARLGAEMARCRRHGAPLCALLCDLDHFKRVNDRYGHAAGDTVLAATAGAIAAELRASDLGARYGGEEFVVLLPETTPSRALVLADRIRTGIAALSIDVDGETLSVTVSIGIAALEAGDTGEQLLARADAAMYAAKSAGRNRCVVANAPRDTIEATLA